MQCVRILETTEVTRMNNSNTLAHFGILGMHWGVHRNTAPVPTAKTKGIVVKEDGSITVAKGANLQRLVRKDGSSLPLKNLTYASLTEYDNAKYIKYIGGKGLFGGGRDTILQLTATEPIKAPSINEASKIVSNMFLTDSKFRNTYTNVLGEKLSPKELAIIKKEPNGKVAKEWYSSVNTALTFDSTFDPSATYVQKTVREALQKKGFNAVRDENDFQAGVSKAPIIIFSPEKTLKVTKISDITDKVRKESKAKLKAYNSLGKKWIEKNLYA